MQSKPKTFEELNEGDHFIAFPTDGDDSGHGGYRKGSNLFTKVASQCRSGFAGLTYNAKRYDTDKWSHMPDNMLVLQIIL